MVLGCNGQDGTYLCRRLLNSSDCKVVGVGLETQPRFQYPAGHFEYVSLDLGGPVQPLADLLARSRPQRIFHVAAVHASAEHAAYEPIFANMLAVNVSTVHAVLEHLRTQDPAARLVYASSAKAFGSPVPSLVNEHTPRKSSCLYGITKNTAGDLIRYYRNAHNVLASQLFLFNHESELRPPGFFIPKLVNALRAASRGACHQERFHTLDFYCDWGSADEYMSIMIDALERAPAEDFVLATGRTVHARTLAQQLFARFEAPMDDYVLEATEHTKAREYTVDIGRLKSLGLAPKVTIEQLIEDLVTARE